MKEKQCSGCKTVNKIEYTLRAGNNSTITIRCRYCKKLMQIKAELKIVPTPA